MILSILAITKVDVTICLVSVTTLLQITPKEVTSSIMAITNTMKVNVNELTQYNSNIRRHKRAQGTQLLSNTFTGKRLSHIKTHTNNNTIPQN